MVYFYNTNVNQWMRRLFGIKCIYGVLRSDGMLLTDGGYQTTYAGLCQIIFLIYMVNLGHRWDVYFGYLYSRQYFWQMLYFGNLYAIRTSDRWCISAICRQYFWQIVYFGHLYAKTILLTDGVFRPPVCQNNTSDRWCISATCMPKQYFWQMVYFGHLYAKTILLTDGVFRPPVCQNNTSDRWCISATCMPKQYFWQVVYFGHLYAKTILLTGGVFRPSVAYARQYFCQVMDNWVTYARQ